MSDSVIRSFNARLGSCNAFFRYHLWRRTLDERLQRADVWEAAARGTVHLPAAVIWRDMCWFAVTLRGVTACPQGDRTLGTGHPGDTAVGPDIDRMDIGHLQRNMARRLGGSDAAVAATHVPFALARLGVTCVLGLATAAAAMLGALCGIGRLGYMGFEGSITAFRSVVHLSTGPIAGV